MPGRGKPFPKKYATEEERKAAKRAAQDRYYAKNRDALIAKTKSKYAADPEAWSRSVWERRLQRQCGITVDQYEEMKKSQRDGCAICGGPPKRGDKYLSIDHCHKTGKVRGLLCSSCNAGIGHLKDDLRLVERAAEYLRGNY